MYTHITDKDTEIRGCHMTGKKSQHSTHKIECLTIKLLLNEVNNLSLDSHHSEENQLCPGPPAPFGGILAELWEAEGGLQGAGGWHMPHKGPVVLFPPESSICTCMLGNPPWEEATHLQQSQCASVGGIVN